MSRNRSVLMGRDEEGDPNQKCWLCGRTSSQVRDQFDRPTPEEVEATRLLAIVEESRARFESTTSGWLRFGAPQFENLDFQFALEHPEQFKNLGVVEGALTTKRTLADNLLQALNKNAAGKTANLGTVEFSPSEPQVREYVTREKSLFEARVSRKLDDGNVFGDIKFAPGLRLLRDVGLLFFSMQKGILQIQREEARGRRPKLVVSGFESSKLFSQIPLCSVCRHLVTG